jgi:hypothetical protein
MKQLMLALLAAALATCASADSLPRNPGNNERQAQPADTKQKEDCRINTSKSNLRQGFTIDEKGVKRQESQQFTIDQKGVKREVPLQDCEKPPEEPRAVSAKQ